MKTARKHPLQTTGQLLEELSAKVILHAARNFRGHPEWLIVLHCFDQDEIKKRLRRTYTRDLDEAIRLFGELGKSIFVRWRGIRASTEQILEAAA